jgi:DNA-directed RNA polymerase beta' subunit
MPIYPPRSEPVKKQEELSKREMELIIAIKKNVAADNLKKIADNYRKAQLSLLKAKVHQFKENDIQQKPNNSKLEKLESLTIEWTDKANDDIINKVKKFNNL